MISQKWLMLAAFLLGCIVTEIRWIGKMRQLRSLLATQEKERASRHESPTIGDAANARAQGVRSTGDTQQSLLGLQEHLTEETQASPLPKTAMTPKP